MSFTAVFVLSRNLDIILGEAIRSNIAVSNKIIKKGVISIIHDLTSDLDDIILKATSEGILYFVKQFGVFTTVIVSNSMLNYEKLANQISWQLLRANYDLFDSQNSPTQNYEEFDQLISSILQEWEFSEDSPIMENLIELTPSAIFQLSKDLREIATYLLLEGKTNVEDIKQITKLDEVLVREKLQKMVQMGYLMKYLDVDSQKEFYQAKIEGGKSK